VRSIKLLI
jgi:uncharacterized protein